jgi:hypothetical protein
MIAAPRAALALVVLAAVAGLAAAAREQPATLYDAVKNNPDVSGEGGRTWWRGGLMQAAATAHSSRLQLQPKQLQPNRAVNHLMLCADSQLSLPAFA